MKKGTAGPGTGSGAGAGADADADGKGIIVAGWNEKKLVNSAFQCWC